MSTRWYAAVAIAVLVTGCAAVDSPRRSSASEPGEVLTFDSPRTIFVVEESPDIGSVTFRGLVRGRTPSRTPAPAPGKVLDVFFGRGDQVTSGDIVLEFLPDPTEAEDIALQIAELTIEQAIADDATPSQLAVAVSARDELEASYDARVVEVRAPTSGVIGTTRQNIVYSVAEDDTLFELSDPADTVIEFTMSVADLANLGDRNVSVGVSGNAATALPGMITEIPNSDGLAASADITVLVDVIDPTAVQLGDRVSISLPVSPTDAAVWVPIGAVGRQAGVPYVLIVDPDNQIARLEVVLGRRTLTHVQALSGITVGTRLVAPK